MAQAHGEIKNPGPFEVSWSTRLLLMIFLGLGVLTAAAALMSGKKDHFWSSFVINNFYFMCLGLGGLFFAGIQWATNAMWSAPVRRLSESFTAYLPFAVITFAILAFGIHDIYHWSHPEYVKGDLLLEGKSGYLEIVFFIIRHIIAFAIWLFFAKKLIGNSIAQDTSGDVSYTLKNRKLAPIFLILFALSFTVVSFDQIMSLDPHWFSTIFGVYCFAGLFYSNLAATCLLTIYFKRKGLLEGVVNENHLHDLGKFMFAFTVFWAYIGFSQFMLIWYANLPEETGYYLNRAHQGWLPFSVVVLFAKFLVPFFVLMPRDAKRNEKVLLFVGVFMLLFQWFDVMWLVQPQFFKEGPQFSWVEPGITLGFLGLFGLAVSRFWKKHNILAVGDPRLKESVLHHHQ